MSAHDPPLSEHDFAKMVNELNEARTSIAKLEESLQAEKRQTGHFFDQRNAAVNELERVGQCLRDANDTGTDLFTQRNAAEQRVALAVAGRIKAEHERDDALAEVKRLRAAIEHPSTVTIPTNSPDYISGYGDALACIARQLDPKGGARTPKAPRTMPFDLNDRADPATCEHAWEAHLWENLKEYCPYCCTTRPRATRCNCAEFEIAAPCPVHR